MLGDCGHQTPNAWSCAQLGLCAKFLEDILKERGEGKGAVLCNLTKDLGKFDAHTYCEVFKLIVDLGRGGMGFLSLQTLKVKFFSMGFCA